MNMLLILTVGPSASLHREALRRRVDTLAAVAFSGRGRGGGGVGGVGGVGGGGEGKGNDDDDDRASGGVGSTVTSSATAVPHDTFLYDAQTQMFKCLFLCRGLAVWKLYAFQAEGVAGVRIDSFSSREQRTRSEEFQKKYEGVLAHTNTLKDMMSYSPLRHR